MKKLFTNRYKSVIIAKTEALRNENERKRTEQKIQAYADASHAETDSAENETGRLRRYVRLCEKGGRYGISAVGAAPEQKPYEEISRIYQDDV